MKAIYKIENQITKDCYIGSSINFAYRKWIHLKRLREGKHHSAILQNSWNKHGEESFSFSILEIVDDENTLINREQFYIDTINPRYNISKIAGSPLGVKHSYEARMNMSIAHKRNDYKSNHKSNCVCTICSRKVGAEHPRYKSREQRFCKCGCGNSFICMATSNKQFINGHNKSQLGRKRTLEQIEKQKQSLKLYYENKLKT